MSLSAAARPDGGDEEDVLARLQGICGARGLDDLAGRLAELGNLLQQDLGELEATLDALPRGQSAVQLGAHHLLAHGGKRLRPMCVALASRMGTGFDESAHQLAVAVELVHAATLLHDDVVDLGEVRRGARAARLVYGNAASIFAGDWLLVEALRRVRVSGVRGALERLLDIVEGMILAESIQLENRGQIGTSREAYFRVVEGKTAALFRWAMFAGARAGGLDDATVDALESYGIHLGVAFQLIDDLLDYTGDTGVTGKELFSDLYEGKMTYPLILALEQDPDLRGELQRALARPGAATLPAELHERLLSAFRSSDTVSRCRTLAAERAKCAVDSLVPLADSRAKDALLTVADATVYREA